MVLSVEISFKGDFQFLDLSGGLLLLSWGLMDSLLGWLAPPVM